MRDRRSFFVIAGCAALCAGALALSCGNEQCCPCPTEDETKAAAAKEEPAPAAAEPVKPAPEPAPPAPAEPPPVVTPPPAAASTGQAAANGLSIVDLVIAKGIEKRQPVEPGTSFAAPQPLKLYAVFNVVNPNLVEDQLAVTWLNPEGKERGKVTLDIPKNSKWKTWAFHGNIALPGRWEAIVRTADGQELGRARFDVTK